MADPHAPAPDCGGRGWQAHVQQRLYLLLALTCGSYFGWQLCQGIPHLSAASGTLARLHTHVGQLARSGSAGASQQDMLEMVVAIFITNVRQAAD